MKRQKNSNIQYEYCVNVSQPYHIYIGEDLTKDFCHNVQSERVFIISDNNVATLYGGALVQSLINRQNDVKLLTIPQGEQSKTLKVYEKLVSQLVEYECDRKATIVALGGGVVGDVASFVASTFMRGVSYIQYPTSLLAMVDSSIGGKTGLNLPNGKNLIGTFWQPKKVFIDVLLLKSLPSLHFRQGVVEMYRNGLLGSTQLLNHIETKKLWFDKSNKALIEAIGRSVRVKASYVERDEKESGDRIYLNLGHTLAHALEAHYKYHLPHGDAVAYGLIMAAKLAAIRGWIDETDRITAFFHQIKPMKIVHPDFSELQPYLKIDKKRDGFKQRWVVLQQIGKPCLVDDFANSELEAAWNYVKEVTKY